jgi:hypothetical protein
VGGLEVPFYYVLSRPWLWPSTVNTQAVKDFNDGINRPSVRIPLQLAVGLGVVQGGAVLGGAAAIEASAALATASAWKVGLAVAGQTDLLGTGLLARAVGSVLALGGAWSAGEASVPRVSMCFAEGTEVLMADGSVKAIEEVREGDLVLAGDPQQKSDPEPRRVTRVVRTATYRIFHVDIGGVEGGEILATGSHPFWTQRGWVDAENLSTSDVLSDDSGSPVVIEAISVESRDVPTFNLSIDQTHTFFVVAGHSRPRAQRRPLRHPVLAVELRSDVCGGAVGGSHVAGGRCRRARAWPPA